MSKVTANYYCPDEPHENLSDAIALHAGWTTTISPEEARELAETLLMLAEAAEHVIKVPRNRFEQLLDQGRYEEVLQDLNPESTEELVNTLIDRGSHSAVEMLFRHCATGSHGWLMAELILRLTKQGGEMLAAEAISSFSGYVQRRLDEESEEASEEEDLCDDSQFEEDSDFCEDPEFDEDSDFCDEPTEKSKMQLERETIADQLFGQDRTRLLAGLPPEATVCSGWRMVNDSINRAVCVDDTVVRNIVVLFVEGSARIVKQVGYVDVKDGQAQDIVLL